MLAVLALCCRSLLCCSTLQYCARPLVCPAGWSTVVSIPGSQRTILPQHRWPGAEWGHGIAGAAAVREKRCPGHLISTSPTLPPRPASPPPMSVWRRCDGFPRLLGPRWQPAGPAVQLSVSVHQAAGAPRQYSDPTQNINRIVYIFLAQGFQVASTF